LDRPFVFFVQDFRAMRARLAILLMLGACTSSPRSPSDPADAAPDVIADAGAPEATSLSCPSGIQCAVPADCVPKGGGRIGCWGCFNECCVPTPEGTDPAKACLDGGTACSPSRCDGTGACSPPQLEREGTPCGQMCGGVFMYQRAFCRQGQCVGDPNTQTACKDLCYGDYTPCDLCDTVGCVASCTPLQRNDRCFQ